MIVKFKKGNSYPSLLTSSRVIILTLLNSIWNKGKVKAMVKVTKESLYATDKVDQADVLKLYGFKSIKQVYHSKVKYYTSYSENIIGFRMKKSTDNHFEFGLHKRIAGKRKFIPKKVELNKWVVLNDLEGYKFYHLPIPPYFGGADSNGDGLGGEAPNDVIIYLKFIW